MGRAIIYVPSCAYWTNPVLCILIGNKLISGSFQPFHLYPVIGSISRPSLFSNSIITDPGYSRHHPPEGRTHTLRCLTSLPYLQSVSGLFLALLCLVGGLFYFSLKENRLWHVFSQGIPVQLMESEEEGTQRERILDLVAEQLFLPSRH